MLVPIALSLWCDYIVAVVSEMFNSSNAFGGEEQSMAFTVREPIIRGQLANAYLWWISYNVHLCLSQVYLQLEKHTALQKRKQHQTVLYIPGLASNV